MRNLLLPLLLTPLLCFGDLNAATRYLMNEPATLFDVSMLRLTRLTDYWEKQMVFNYKHASKSDGAAGNVNAYYDQDTDKIVVVLSAIDEASSREQMDAGCRYALKHIRIYVRKSMGEVLQHAGPVETPISQDVVSQFREMFELRCYISGNDSSDGRFWASQPLGSDEMKIGRWPVD